MNCKLYPHIYDEEKTIINASVLMLTCSLKSTPVPIFAINFKTKCSRVTFAKSMTILSEPLHFDGFDNYNEFRKKGLLFFF